MKPRRDPKDRILAKIDVDANGCWLWQGTRRPDGYVQIRMPDEGLRYAHRVSYEAFVGPIAEGMTLDHLCRVRHCVSPFHLEVVTHRENCLRGTGVSAIAAAKTHCPRGHEYDTVGSKGERRCSTCLRDQKRAYKRRQRVAA